MSFHPMIQQQEAGSTSPSTPRFIPLKILATGKALPSLKVSSASIDLKLGLPPGTCFLKSGIESRHFAAADESQGQLGAAALHDALHRSGIKIESLDLLISASAVQEQALPSTSCAIALAAKLPPGIPAFDINASCLSFLVALHTASSLLNTGAYRRIAIVSADLASRGLNWNDPESSYIFGDGAACAIIERGDGSTGIEAYLQETYPEGFSFCEIRGGGTRLTPNNGALPSDFHFRMDGKAVFKMAAQKMPGHIDKLLAQAACCRSSIDVAVPHQASHLGMKHVLSRLGLPEGSIVNIYPTHGNQVAASIPSALHEAFVSGQAAPGKRLLLLGTAAGLTIGSMLIRL